MDDGSNCHPSPVKENRLVAVPVVAGSSGLGLPYAPEDWPCPGDRWRWKVGTRKSSSGHWVDRYLYAPPTCPKSGGRRHGNGFPSRVSVEEYIRKEFPDADVNAFFSSFIWRVPCADFTPQKGLFFVYHLVYAFAVLCEWRPVLLLGCFWTKLGSVICPDCYLKKILILFRLYNVLTSISSSLFCYLTCCMDVNNLFKL